MTRAILWRWGPWVLVAAVFATRLPFMTQTLYAFDSANYALAVRDYYNVAHHRPHPPGYPVYVVGAWLINLALQDPNRSLVLFGILLSALAVGSTTALAGAMYGRPAGLLAGLLLLFTVGFWGYGEVAYPYVALAAEASTLALLAHLVLTGRHRAVIPLGLGVALAGGIRADGAVFALPFWLWALTAVSWRLRALSVGAAIITVVAWAVPMVMLTGGLDVYRAAAEDYLKVWAPQSGFVPGDFGSGQGTLASYNLNFFVNYVRQMLGVGVLTLLYFVGRRLGPASLGADYRSRFLLLWIVPPILVYVFSHLGEAGYVLALAPQAATVAAVTAWDLRAETSELAAILRARGWGWIPSPRVAGSVVAAGLVIAIVGWNLQAFLRGVGPGRLPDLLTRDAITSSQVSYLASQPRDSTLVLAHDLLRQVEYYLPGQRVQLLYSEYVPQWETVRTRTAVPSEVRWVVVLDNPIEVAPEDRNRVREVVLRESPRVAVLVVDAADAQAVEHGYRFLRVVPR